VCDAIPSQPIFKSVLIQAFAVVKRALNYFKSRIPHLFRNLASTEPNELRLMMSARISPMDAVKIPVGGLKMDLNAAE